MENYTCGLDPTQQVNPGGESLRDCTHQNRAFIKQGARAESGMAFSSHKTWSSSKGRGRSPCGGCQELLRMCTQLEMGPHPFNTALSWPWGHTGTLQRLRPSVTFRQGKKSSAMKLQNWVLQRIWTSWALDVPSPEQPVQEEAHLEMRNGLEPSALITGLKGLFFSGTHLT